MEFAIIAAGEGSRLIKEGISTPKPLVQLNGIPLIGRLINTFVSNGASKIHVVINEYSGEVESYLNLLKLPLTLNIIKKTTSSSLHSFHQLIAHIQDNSICLTTVDTIFNEQEFATYLAAFKNENSIDGLMAVTEFVDDESPLYVVTDNDMQVTHYLDERNDKCRFVSGGIYCLRRPVFGLVDKAIQSGTGRMRNFQRLLVQEGFKIKAHVFSKIIDIDHAADITTAGQWLNGAEAAVSDFKI